MYRGSAGTGINTGNTRGGSPMGDDGNGDGDYVVKIEQVPRWIDAEQHRCTSVDGSEDASFSVVSFSDPLSSVSPSENDVDGTTYRFPVDLEINSRFISGGAILGIWKSTPWLILPTR